MKLRKDKKDWEIARDMMGKNGKEECHLVRDLRKYGYMNPHCEGWYIIYDSRREDDCGWLISAEWVEES